MFTSILTLALAASSALACADHSYHARSHNKRADPVSTEWAYEASYNWGRLDKSYHLCQDGTQQSPIPLQLTQGLSQNHVPSFSYGQNHTGRFYNWGYGPAMSLDHAEGDYTTLPSFTFEEDGKNETVYMTGWHIHAPADHSVQGDRSKAEMHFVHTNAEGSPRAVLAFRIDPGNHNSNFFDELPAFFDYRDLSRNETILSNPSGALAETGYFTEFWTYRGSLTSPPCTEGIRFFVARNILFVGNQQMRDILNASTYSARSEQEVWLHQINV